MYDLDAGYNYLKSLYHQPSGLVLVDHLKPEAWINDSISTLWSVERDKELRREIYDGLSSWGYGALKNGCWEALYGDSISVPPLRTLPPFQLGEVDGVKIYHEPNSGSPVFEWTEFALWLMIRSLSCWNRGSKSEAINLYRRAISLWDGMGFYDRYVRADPRHCYVGYHLGLALYLYRVYDYKNESLKNQWIDRLAGLQAQEESGGISTLYDTDGIPFNGSCASTEPTALALGAFEAKEPFPIIGGGYWLWEI